MWFVKRAVRHPFFVLLLAIALLVAVPDAYGNYGKGVEFFPNVEPDYGLLYVHARGNLSIAEKDALVRQAEHRILGWPGIKSVYTRVGARAAASGNDVDADVVGTIQYEFVDWRERKGANEILADLREAMAGIPGAEIEVSVPQAGPPTGKAIQILLSADEPDQLNETAVAVADATGQGAGRHRHLRRPAAARRRLGAEGRPRQGRPLRRSAAIGRRHGAAGHQRGEADRLPPGRRDDAVDIRLRLRPSMRTMSSWTSCGSRPRPDRCRSRTWSPAWRRRPPAR